MVLKVVLAQMVRVPVLVHNPVVCVPVLVGVVCVLVLVLLVCVLVLVQHQSMVCILVLVSHLILIPPPGLPQPPMFRLVSGFSARGAARAGPWLSGPQPATGPVPGQPCAGAWPSAIGALSRLGLSGLGHRSSAWLRLSASSHAA